MSYLLGIDLGTSAVKASVIDGESGQVLSTSPVGLDEIPRYAPQPGWSEQDPANWWTATVQAVTSLPASHRQRVAAIGIAYQMHGLVLLNAHGDPVRPAILWSDSRASCSGEDLLRERGDDLLGRTLNRPGNFTSAKLRWVRDHEPAAFAESETALLPGDYLALKLTGEARTTAPGISEMAAWDFGAARVCEELFDRPELLPPLAETFGEQGRLSAASAAALGLPAGTPVTYRAGDQPNNALALGVLEPGEMAASGGTSGVLYGITAQALQDPRERINPFLHVNRNIGLLFCLNGAGGYYSWLRRFLGASSFEALNELALQSPPGANGLVAFPFGNGAERVLGGRLLGASFEGIDANRHSPDDFARAGLEGIVYAFRLGSEAMMESGMRPQKVRAGESGLFRSGLFCQLLADTLGVELRLYNTDGATGAARGAGIGLGLSEADAFRGLAEQGAFSPSSTYNDSPFQAWKSRLDDRLSKQ